MISTAFSESGGDLTLPLDAPEATGYGLRARQPMTYLPQILEAASLLSRTGRSDDYDEACLGLFRRAGPSVAWNEVDAATEGARLVEAASEVERRTGLTMPPSFARTVSALGPVDVRENLLANHCSEFVDVGLRLDEL